MVLLLEIPTPETLVQLVWLGLGIVFARGFGKQLDQDIQTSMWFSTLNEVQQNILKRLLDVMHHWWMGLLLVIYATNSFTLIGQAVNVNAELVWFGWGMVVDDLPDIPFRYGVMERKPVEPGDE